MQTLHCLFSRSLLGAAFCKVIPVIDFAEGQCANGFSSPSRALVPFPLCGQATVSWAGIFNTNFNTNAIAHSSQGFFWHELSCEKAASAEMYAVLGQACKSHFLPQRAKTTRTTASGAQHQCRGLRKVDVTLGPPVHFGNPLRCV